MTQNRKVEFKGTFDIQEILNTVNDLQNRLSGIKLDDASVKRFEKTFVDIKKRAQEIDAEIKQGFTNTNQINNFNNHLLKLGQQMEVLRGEISRIDTSFNNLQLSPSVQKQFDSLKNSANSMFDAYETQLSNIENKISAFASKSGISFSEEEISGLSQVISQEKELTKIRDQKVSDLNAEKQSIEQSISSLKEKLEISKQEVQTARENRDITTKLLAEQRAKISSMKTSEVDPAELEKERNIRSDLIAKNEAAGRELRNQEKTQEKIEQNLRDQESELSKINSSLESVTRFFNTLSGNSSGLDDDAAAAAQEFTDLRNIVNDLENKLNSVNIELEEFKRLQSQETKIGFEKSQKDLDGVGEGLRKTSEAAGETADNLESLNKQDAFFDNLKARATAIFGLGNAFIYVNRFIRESVQAIKELDDAFTEIAVVTNMTTSQLWESFDTYNQMAQRLGTTTVDAIKTSALYYQQGLETAEVMQLTEETMKMARIAGMDYAEATDRMTAALRGFKLEMEDAQRVNDVFSALAAESAVDTDELSSALTRTASIAASAGMELETTSAFLSQMIETTREAPENIGTAMKTIIARFQELKTAVSDSVEIDGELVEVNKVDTALQSVGVQLRDSLTGQFRDLDEVFLELSSKWDTLDRNTQRYIATIAAGSRQQSRFIAMMDNYERTLELVDIAQNSNGASASQFEKTLDSLQARLNLITSSFEEFIGTVLKSDFVKGVLDAVNNILQMINDIAEQGPVAITIFGTFFIVTIKKVITNFINSIKIITTAFSSAWKGASGDMEDTIKKANQNAISDLENRIRNSNISKLIAEQIRSGISSGTSGKRVKVRTSSNSSLVKENEEISGSLGKIKNALSSLAPALGQIVSTISSLGTTAILGSAATKSASALAGATTGTMAGSLVGSLGYLLPGGAVLGPILSSVGGTLGALIGEGISDGLDKAKYGIGSEESINGFKEAAEKVSEETSQTIEETNDLVSLGEEYLSLSEKVNLTNEEKSRLLELNNLLIDQWDGLEYINSAENGYREINVENLKAEIKEKKELIALEQERASYATYEAERAQAIRNNIDLEEEARAQIEDILKKGSGDFSSLGFTAQAMTPEQLGRNFFNALGIDELSKENSDELIQTALKFGIDEEQFSSALDNYFSVMDSNKEKLKDYFYKLDQDISSILEAGYSGISSTSFASQQKSHLSELLKIENLFDETEIDNMLESNEGYLDEIFEKRLTLVNNFINNLNSFDEEQQEAFANAVSMIGLFTDENGNVSSNQIIAYLEAELGESSDAVISIFNEIFEAEKDTLSKNWDSLIDENKKYINSFVDNFDEKTGALIATKFGAMAAKMGEEAPVFVKAFQDSFSGILEKYTFDGEVIEDTKEEFYDVLDLLSATDASSARSIAKLSEELRKLGFSEKEVINITNSMGSIFGRSGLTATEALDDIQSELEQIEELIDIIGDNADGALSLSQIDKLNTKLQDMGQNILDTSNIVATGEGFKIKGGVSGIIGASLESTQEQYMWMAKQAEMQNLMLQEQAQMIEDETERQQLMDQATEAQKTRDYYLLAEANTRAQIRKAAAEAENEEKQRLYDLIQTMKDMIAELDRYYNLQRKILELQNEQKDLELNLELASGSDEIADIFRKQVLNLVQQQKILKQSTEVYAKDLKQLGDYINSEYGQYLNVDDSGNIFQNNDELISLAERLEGASEAEAEQLQREWDSIKEVQSAYEELYDLAISSSQEYQQNLIDQRELEEQMLQYQIDLQKTLRDMVIAEMQEEVEKVKEKYQKIKNEDQKYLTSLQKNINKRKQLQEDQDAEKEIETIQKRIALLSRDTSGIYAKEIESLQEELQGKLQEQENTALDRMYEQEQEKTQLVSDELDKRQEFLQNQLDLELETYTLSNQKVTELLKLKDEEILEWMKQHSEDFRKSTTEEQAIFVSEWSRQIELAKGAQQTLTDDLEVQKVQILNKFDEIEVNGINRYIENIHKASSEKLVVNTDTSQLEVAISKVGELGEAYDDFVKKQAVQEMDRLLVNIENAYSEGNIAEGERLMENYNRYFSLYTKYGGNPYETVQMKGYGQNGTGYTYYSASERAKSLGNRSYNTTQIEKKKNEFESLYGNWNANSDSGLIDIYSGPSESDFYKNHQTNNPVGGGDMTALTVQSIKENDEGTWAQVVTRGSDSLAMWMDTTGGPKWVKVSQLKALYSKYAAGGIVDYTGPAWVDGTPSKPEAFLSSADTSNIAKLTDVLSKVFNTSKTTSDSYSTNQNTGDVYYEFHITVDELGNGYDAGDMMKDMEKYIVQKSNYRNVINIGNRR